jgi:hypothetical protein
LEGETRKQAIAISEHEKAAGRRPKAAAYIYSE